MFPCLEEGIQNFSPNSSRAASKCNPNHGCICLCVCACSVVIWLVIPFWNLFNNKVSFLSYFQHSRTTNVWYYCSTSDLLNSNLQDYSIMHGVFCSVHAILIQDRPTRDPSGLPDMLTPRIFVLNASSTWNSLRLTTHSHMGHSRQIFYTICSETVSEALRSRLAWIVDPFGLHIASLSYSSLQVGTFARARVGLLSPI